MRRSKTNLRHAWKKAGKVFSDLTIRTERTARISLLLCTAIVAGSCISVSAVSIQSRNDTIIADSTENIDEESIVVSYEEFLDITSDVTDETTLTPEERRHMIVEGVKNKREYEGTPYGDEDDEEVSAEVIENTAPQDLSDRQITRMLSGNAGRVRVIRQQDLNVSGSNSGSSEDLGNASATVSNSVSSSFDASNNYVIGIDVSAWNSTINWSKVKAYGVQFAIIKCGGRYYGSGGLYSDSKFVTNARGAAAAGIKVGVYFFSAATSIQEAYEEASFTVNMIKNNNINVSYPVAIDFEINGSGYRTYGIASKTLRDVLATFCDTVASQGYSPMIYMSSRCWTSVLGTQYAGEMASKYKVWLAAYFTSSGKTTAYKIGDKLPSFPYRYHIWQYGFIDGSPLGMSGDVDMNLGFFSSQTLLDPTITLNGEYLYTTAGTVISATQGVSAMNSLGQSVNPSNFNIKIYNSSNSQVSMADACATPGVYHITYSFGDAYRGVVSQTFRLLVANPTDGSIPGCSPTPVPESSTSETSESSSSESTSGSSSSETSESTTESTTASETSESTTESTTQPTESTEAPADEAIV